MYIYLNCDVKLDKNHRINEIPENMLYSKKNSQISEKNCVEHSYIQNLSSKFNWKTI